MPKFKSTVNSNKEKQNEDLTRKKKQKEEITIDDVSVKQETIARFNRERLRRIDHSASDFYVCLVFQSWDQVQEFLNQVKSPKLYDVYVDGEEFANEIGKPVTPNELPPERVKVNKKRLEMVNLNAIRSANKLPKS